MLAPSPRFCRFIPFGRYTLRDFMEQISGRKLIEIGFDAGSAVRGADARDGVIWDTEPELDGYLSLAGMAIICKSIGADILGEILQGTVDDDDYQQDNNKKPSSGEVLRFYNAFARELESHVFVHLPVERSRHYQNDELLSDDAKRAFPNAAQELLSASNAYALGLAVACVFHCMRALEYGLASLSRNVELVWTKEQWHTIIEAIESRIEKERRTLKSGSARDERLRFLSSAAKEFFYFKDGWRNYVVHNRVHYEAPQALQVLEHTRTFIERISTQLNEQS